ncbi:class I SAM-dependent methyltransferase [Tichowtungia aerotolerans]|uniref:Methyltransferase domain-containing protein n=1 Tax=Tichowtungia aerotolerans TaxID=2697043 RepID=A0A6P1M7X0_9BACT|nr:methyltransferase domain-containing protein [Tichowtungia aerotolerans]QHI68624.1 methyltransferase domain-containing protein [Tichowtungia aerotolerans]
MKSTEKEHKRQIIDQFSKQAVPFTELPGHLSAIEMLTELSQPHKDDQALDVACGPGLVACAFAPQVQHIEGIDITQAMIDQAQKRQQEEDLKNISWKTGTVDPLPYGSESFSLVITRYSFHHFLHPRNVLSEMIRVCRPGGRILVADAVLPADKAEAYDRMEKLRDSSHTRVLKTGELDNWFKSFGLTECRQCGYSVDVELEAQLNASFPEPGDEVHLRKMITNDIGKNALGINARKQNEAIWFSYPISVYAGRKSF